MPIFRHFAVRTRSHHSTRPRWWSLTEFSHRPMAVHHPPRDRGDATYPASSFKMPASSSMRTPRPPLSRLCRSLPRWHIGLIAWRYHTARSGDCNRQQVPNTTTDWPSRRQPPVERGASTSGLHVSGRTSWRVGSFCKRKNSGIGARAVSRV